MSKTNTYLFLLLCTLLFFSCERKRNVDITGNVYDAYNGSKLSGVNVKLTCNYSEPSESYYYHSSSDLDGHFNFKNATFKKPLMNGFLEVSDPNYRRIDNAEISKNEIKFLGKTKISKNVSALCFSDLNLSVVISSSIQAANYIISKKYIHPSNLFGLFSDFGNLNYPVYPPADKVFGYSDGKTILRTYVYNNVGVIVKTQYDTIISPGCRSTINYTITVN